MTHDVAVVGGGIVGLASAWALRRRFPGARLVLLEKERGLGRHQTGHNSGVIHSGLYYEPGSLRARLCRAGAASMVAFCREHGIAHRICGKIIVATAPHELPRLAALRGRAAANGVAAQDLDADGIRALEPHAAGLAGLHVPGTGIADYPAVAAALAGLFAAAGGEVRTEHELHGIEERPDALVLHTGAGEIETRFLVTCGGLHGDRLARLAGVDAEAHIVPFRGEYYDLVPGRRDLVRALIYPVPDPAFPFLGVHLSRTTDGRVHAGPNAVLAWAREGYARTDVDFGDLFEVAAFPGLWRLAWKHRGAAAAELWRSLSKAAFLRSVQRLLPALQADDLEASPAGVRAQALRRDGSLVDDFLLLPGRRSLHVCNAPSPAATASLEIGEAVAARVPAPCHN